MNPTDADRLTTTPHGASPKPNGPEDPLATPAPQQADVVEATGTTEHTREPHEPAGCQTKAAAEAFGPGANPDAASATTPATPPTFDIHYLRPPYVSEDTPPEEVAANYNDEFDLDDLILGEIEAGLRYMLWVLRCVKWASPERPNPLDDPAALATRLAKATGEFVHEIVDDNRPGNTSPRPPYVPGELQKEIDTALARRRAEGKSDPD